jgi:hypothetical protein
MAGYLDRPGTKVAGSRSTRGAAPTSSGATVTAGGAVNDPLGLAIAPNGDLLTTLH